MSLTTIAAPIRPDEKLALLPPSRPERFQASDFIASGLVFVITLGVYIATLAPSVTLEDSGELITAATKFGVGHPPGYPLWTLLGFLLSHIFPFGNLAWRINLLSALFGATSNAVLTLLACHSGRWLLQRWTDESLQPVVRRFCFYAGLLAGLTIGFSDVMWCQAVIAAVHGTIQALILNLVLLMFYLWMLEPKKTHRLVLAVLVFSLGLTNHHTLVQIIPAFLLAAFLIEVVPTALNKPASARPGIFFSVFLAVNLFSLSILTYLSWLSGDDQLHRICEVMAEMIFAMTGLISFFYLKEFRLHLFLLGAGTAILLFAYGHYFLLPNDTSNPRYAFLDSHGYYSIMLFHKMYYFNTPFWLWGSIIEPGWMQITTLHGVLLMAMAAMALGLLYSSTLDRRLVIGVFAVGWLGLVPYAYEPFASSTNPPMNWGFASERSGFYYAVSREQYPKSLPVLIKSTFGKLIGVVPKDAQLDATIGLPDYFPRLGKTFYFYGDNLQRNFTVPLIFLTLAVLVYIRRCDWPQVNWYIFLGAAFFFLGFMLQLIAPQEGFDLEHNLQYKVFHLQSHCILVLLMSYGALAAMTYLQEAMPEITEKVGIIGLGLPTLGLTLLPLWSNFDDCNQAGHWFGYDYGVDMMSPMDKNAVYYGGSDPGRFVPTFAAFVESQQDDRWKRKPFDRRDVAVITQNALCDTYYTKYIRNQYDDRFRIKPKDYTPFEKWLGRDKAYPQESITCMSNDELLDCWDEYQARPEVKARVDNGGPLLRPGSNDVFDINGIVAQKIFEKNKKDHTFYLEQSVPMDWTYPYLEPAGLILKFSTEPLQEIPPALIEADRKFWDAYSQKLLQDPKFRLDVDAKLTFSKLAFWHSDLYGWRHLDAEEEHWLKISIALCPQLPDAVNHLTRLMAKQQRFDEAVAVAQQAIVDDPGNDQFPLILDWLEKTRSYGKQEEEMHAELAKSPYDVGLNLNYAQLLQDEGKLDELNDRMRILAGLTNWNREAMSDVISYYVDKAHNLDAVVAFLEARAKIDPSSDEMIYNLAAFHAVLNHKEAALKYLAQAAAASTNALVAARMDQRFEIMRDDPRFLALLNSVPPAGTNPAPVAPPTPAKKSTAWPTTMLPKPPKP